ncbi:hypothetical protein F4776DRAFT_44280 [Hypoxylon sp. NC0597]|nr:hypothetical protein F4776DRAFT_44280 [Hypoxylon sp. NC0597]
MCHQWELKTMYCGHFEADYRRVPCEAWDPAYPNDCQIWYHPSPEFRPYTPGDGECRECLAARQAMAEKWFHATGIFLDDAMHDAFVNARAYLFSLDFVSLAHLDDVQDEMIMAYIFEDRVLDVDAALRVLGYHIPEVAFEVGNEGQNQEPMALN